MNFLITYCMLIEIYFTFPLSFPLSIISSILIYRLLCALSYLFVQPRPSAINTTLPAFAAAHRAAAPLLLSAGDCYRSIFPARGALSSKPAAAAVDRWDIPTDTDAQPFHKPCCLVPIVCGQCQSELQ